MSSVCSYKTVQKMSRISCSICYDVISSESILLHLDCGHIYHDKCVSLWFQRSTTCPDCRKRVTKFPSRVYPNFDVKDDEGKLQLQSNFEVLESENKKLQDEITQLRLNQQNIIAAKLAEKTYEVMKVTNAMKSLEQLYIDTKATNEELTRTNDEITERLNLCHGKLNSVNDLLLSQQNESTSLSNKIMDLEKQLQFAESDAQMDKYFRTVAINEKDELMEQLNDTRHQLLYAQNTIDRDFVQIETVLCELERTKTEKQLQTIRMKQLEQTICECDVGRREIGQENVQLKSKLKEIMSQGTICSSGVAQKRKYTDCCCNSALANDNIEQILRSDCSDTTETDRPPIKLIIKKMKIDSNFACISVL